MVSINIRKNIISGFVLSMILSLFWSVTILALDYDTEINNKKSEIINITSEIEKLKLDLNNTSNNKNVTINQINSILESINHLTAIISDTKITIEDLINDIENKVKLIQQNEGKRIEIMSQTFKDTSNIADSASQSQIELFAKEDNYTKSVFGLKIHEKKVEIINALNQDKNSLEKNIKDFESSLISLNDQIKELENKKQELTSKLNVLISSENSAANQINGMQKRVGQIQTEIAGLMEEQKKAIERDRQIQQSSQVITVSASDIKQGEIYFSGRGRDLYDGHAVGMSQWGIYGAGFAGMDYSTILKKYYTGVTIGGDFSDRIINVAGYGKIDIETYVSGLGEIPSFACETDSNKGKDYVIKDNPDTTWDCWPEEAIKAQVVAARSYALAQISSNPNKVVATDATFQVYAGHDSKRWAANATKGQVILYNGNIVTALYSSSMRGHSEDNELFFTRKAVSTLSKQDLVGTPYPYLRGIDDSSWTYRNSTYNWNWKTKSYSLEKLSDIFANTDIDVGNLQSISSETGKSDRVWVVTLAGDKGTKYVTGWKFKEVMNNWIYENEPVSSRAFIYSTEFLINK